MSNSRLAGHSTIHFDADLYQAMVLKSAESGESLSDLVNRAMHTDFDAGLAHSFLGLVMVA